MIRIGLGQSEHIDTKTAVECVIAQCRQQLSETKPQVGIVFAGVNFNHRLMLDEILQQFPGLDLIGCTTAGDFSSSYGFSDDSISLMLLWSDDIEFGIGVGRSLSENPEEAVESAVGLASHQISKPVSICLSLPDGFNTAFDSIMKMLNATLGDDCSIFGGAAGTLWNEHLPPLQFYRNEILMDSMPIMLLGGPLEHSFSIANSWRPVGNRACVTSAEDRIVKRIGIYTAVDFYRYYLGDHSEPAREFTLAVYEKGYNHSYLCATIAYHPDGSITFSGSIPEGATVQLTEAIRDVILKDTEETSKKIVQDVSEWDPAFAMAFSCAFRKEILGTRVPLEIQTLKDHLPQQLPIIGFYSFGEIAPLVKGQESFIHCDTLVTLIVGQRNGQSVSVDDKEADQLLGDTFLSLSEDRSDDRNQTQQIKLENEFLKRKLDRSESYRARLEEIKDFNSALHRKIIKEVEDARMEIQRKETELRKSEEKYRRIVTTAGEGFSLMDEEMVITDANDAFCQMIGYQRGDLLGKTPFDFSTDELRLLFNADQSQPQTGVSTKLEGSLKAKDRQLIPALFHGSKLRDDSGQIIGNMAFVTDQTEQKKALALAAEVQRSLLPQYGVNLPGLDVAGKNVICEEIGGDYFDFLEPKDYPDAPFGIVVGDIAGHGVDAALLMTSARAFLRMRASQSGKISDIVTEMNRHLTSDVQDSGRFMTLFYLTIDPNSGSLQWVRAGHDPAVLYDPQRNAFEELAGTGIALGVKEDFRYQENSKIGIADGQIIALGTDGLWEACDKNGIMFGKKRFRDVIRHHAKENAAHILDAVYDELDQYTSGLRSEDDITLVVAKVGEH